MKNFLNIKIWDDNIFLFFYFFTEASQLKETRQNILHHLLGEDSINTAVDLEFSHAVNKKLIMKRAFLTPEDETDGGIQK